MYVLHVYVGNLIHTMIMESVAKRDMAAGRAAESLSFVSVLTLISDLYGECADIPAAVRYAERALQALDKLNPHEVKVQTASGRCHTKLGCLLAHLGRTSESVIQFKSSVATFERAGASSPSLEVAQAWENLAGNISLPVNTILRSKRSCVPNRWSGLTPEPPRNTLMCCSQS